MGHEVSIEESFLPEGPQSPGRWESKGTRGQGASAANPAEGPPSPSSLQESGRKLRSLAFQTAGPQPSDQEPSGGQTFACTAGWIAVYSAPQSSQGSRDAGFEFIFKERGRSKPLVTSPGLSASVSEAQSLGAHQPHCPGQRHRAVGWGEVRARWGRGSLEPGGKA